MHHEVEAAPRDELRELQNERLGETLRNVYENVEFYRDRLDTAGVSPSDVETVEDLTEIPFTTAQDIRDEYPDGLFTVPDDRLQRIHSSSGTTGKPKIFGYTQADLDNWADLVARSLATTGIEPGDTVQNACKYGLVSGGIGWHDAIERLGVTVVPSSVATAKRQIELVRDLGVDGLICMPSFALKLAETVEAEGGDPTELPLSAITVGAEPTSPELRREITDAFDVVVTEHYGLSELLGAGIAPQCAECRDGKHIWEDHFYPEIVDPETGERLAEGEAGELVLTSLTKDAMPVLRYRTGDLATMTTEPCGCGRTHARIFVKERMRNELVVGDSAAYPTDIESTLLSVPGTAPYYRIDLTRPDQRDEIAITIEHKQTYDGDAGALAERLRERLADDLSLRPDELTVAPPGELDRPDGEKVTRVFDHRE